MVTGAVHWCFYTQGALTEQEAATVRKFWKTQKDKVLYKQKVLNDIVCAYSSLLPDSLRVSQCQCVGADFEILLLASWCTY